MQALSHFFLIGSILDTQANDISTKCSDFLVVIPERAALWGASPRPRNLIPALGQRHIGLACHWIAVDDDCVDYRTEINNRTVSRSQNDIREPLPEEMIGSAIILRHWKVFGQIVDICHF
jgi:hypothetical protein